MQKNITLQPQGFAEALKFSLRRPDAKWRAPLVVTPTDGRIFQAPDNDCYKFEEQVRGMKTILWIPKPRVDAAQFEVEDRESLNWWQGEWREVVGDYLRRLVPNSPSVFLMLILLVVTIAILVQSQRHPEQVMQYIMNSDPGEMATTILFMLIGPLLVSFWICHKYPARTRVANLIFQIETWLLLVSILSSIPDIKPGIENFRTQAQTVFGQSPE